LKVAQHLKNDPSQPKDHHAEKREASHVEV